MRILPIVMTVQFAKIFFYQEAKLKVSSCNFERNITCLEGYEVNNAEEKRSAV